MKDTLRLLITEHCNRSCEGCCNKQWDLSKIPVATHHDIISYPTIILTGGEPMLHPGQVTITADHLRAIFPRPRLILYTAHLDLLVSWKHEVVWRFSGITLTLHDQKDADKLVDAYHELEEVVSPYHTMRLNVFKGIKLGKINDFWQVKQDIEWIENCPLPEHEVFMRLR